ncbi:MAG: hypothetical protein WA055_01755 [Candidatus Moraniibacteriota bacterium]
MSIKKEKIHDKGKLKSNHRCGLCGKSKNLVKTDCCGNWICNDENKYKLFSYARNSCSRNHGRFTLCAYHKNENHKGDWKTCKKCLVSFEHELEMYVWYGTNKYNFEKLENPPVFKPTYCTKCGEKLILPDGGFSVLCGVYYCENCEMTEAEREKIISGYKKKNNLIN